jgi:phage terminase large subunit-like protein
MHIIVIKCHKINMIKIPKNQEQITKEPKGQLNHKKSHQGHENMKETQKMPLRPFLKFICKSVLGHKNHHLCTC